MPRFTTKQLRDIAAKLEDSIDSGKPVAAEFERFAVREMLKKYSYKNLLLIFSQYPEAVHVAGFYQWKQAGRKVKKGAQGIGIICPVTAKRTDDNGEDIREIVNTRVGYVFDISQTEPMDAAPVTSAPVLALGAGG